MGPLLSIVVRNRDSFLELDLKEFRKVLPLGLCHALSASGGPLVVLVGSFIGSRLAPDPTWSTLPLSVMIIGVAASTIPASLIMKRWGRKKGFIGATLVSSIACLGATYTIIIENFWLFCVAMAVIGANLAFTQQYRFAAAESVDSQFTSKAVSLVLLGGIVAGFLGPELGKQTRDWFVNIPYAGSFIGLAILYVLNAVLLFFFFQDTDTASARRSVDHSRPLIKIVTQPIYVVAVMAGAIAFGVMSLIMTATPINMHDICGFSLDDTTFVIQSHFVGMFLPSLFTGQLIKRWGVLQVMTIGVVCFLICILLAWFEPSFMGFWWALVLLGIGWNFLFIGGTVLLTETYRPEERFKAQAINDFIVFGVQALASLFAGQLIFTAGWFTLNVLNLPLLCLMMFSIGLLYRKQRQAFA